MNALSIKNCLSFGWQSFKSRPWIFIGVGALVMGINLITNAITGGLEYLDPENPLIGLLILIISIAVSILLGAGTTNFVLKAHDNVSEAKITDLWVPQYFWRYLGATIIIGLATLIGLILLIVPGIIIGLGFYCVLYLIVDQNMGVKAALKRSWELTKGNRWKLFLLGLTLMLINLVGLLALFIGLIVTVPITYMAVVHAYRTLVNNTVPAVVAE